MKVSVQYAESHLTELLPMPDAEAIETSEGAAAHETVSSAASTKRGLWGAGKGEIWMADDWDSAETNEEIARLFNDGPIFPNEPAA